MFDEFFEGIRLPREQRASEIGLALFVHAPIVTRYTVAGSCVCRAVSITGGTNTMQKITALSKQMNLDLSVINGKDHAESFLLLTNDRVAAFSEDDILLAGLAATSQTPNAFRLISIEGMLADPYALMMRRDDPQFKAAVDAALRAVFASGEIQRIYDKWFVRPIPPRNVVLNFPMGDQLKRVIAKPIDSGDPQDYK